MLEHRNQILIAVVVGSLFIAAISSLTFKVTDEENWIKAGRSFKNALVELRPEKTFVPEVSHRLGVSVLWVSSFVYITMGSFPAKYLVFMHRSTFLVLNLLLFAAALKVLQKHLDFSVCVLSVLYLFMNRLFPIIGRSTWLDQFLTMFGLLSISLWVSYLFKRRNSYLILSGVLNGLIMLTKYAGWYFPLITITLTIIYCFKTNCKIKDFIFPLIISLTISLLVFVLLYPAMWVDPMQVLFMRFSDTRTLVKDISDAWFFIKELRLIDPVLISGIVFIILDWLKGRKNFLFFLGLGGGLYLSFYILTFISLSLFGRLDYPFLAGIYRYTFPAIPILSIYTFYRYKVYIRDQHLQFIFVLLLFTREIIFSPFLLF